MDNFLDPERQKSSCNPQCRGVHSCFMYSYAHLDVIVTEHNESAFVQEMLY